VKKKKNSRKKEQIMFKKKLTGRKTESFSFVYFIQKISGELLDVFN
jgi:hypothetical protein